MHKVQKQFLFLVKEEGQALVLMVLFLSFVFLALAALAIDGTNIQLHRRQLQNMADASALAAAIALSQGKDEAEAYQIAMDTIAANDGRPEWYSLNGIPDAPVGNFGSGVGLIQGVEITDACDVRVALRWSDVGTYFAQFVGRERLQVGAKARAACNRAGGLMPIAIKRFGDERDWNMSLTTDNAATVYCDDCDPQRSIQGPPPQGLGNLTDFLRPAISDTITEWPGWPNGPEIYQSPSPHADLTAGAAGREYFILGAGVDPNVGTVSYAGLVNLDIRHISSPPREYVNGVPPGTQANTLKDLAEYYIRHGYCCDIPVPGEQVAIFNGGSTRFAPEAFQDTYAVGDVVAVIVYNGYAYDTPSLEVIGDTPNYKFTYPTTNTVTSSPLTYSITLKAKGAFQSQTGGTTLDVEGLDGFAEWSFSPTSSPVLGAGASEIDITLHVTPTVTTVGTTTHVVTGTRVFYISITDNGPTAIKRYWAGIVTIGDEVNGVQRTLPAVTCTPNSTDQNYPFISVARGQQAKYTLDLDLWGVDPDQEVDVTVTSGPLPTDFGWVTAPPWTYDIQSSQHAGVSFNVNIKTGNNVITNTVHEIPLTVSAPGRPDIVPQTCKLYILVEEARPTVKKYVEILGYAAVEVTGYYNSTNPVNPGQSANAVRGRIVSKLMIDPSELTYGLRARLIPWEQ